MAEKERKEEAVNEEEAPQSPDSDIEEEIDWAALEERAEEYDSESDKKLTMKKVMKQMRSGQYFLVILASLTPNSCNIFCVDCFTYIHLKQPYHYSL